MYYVNNHTHTHTNVSDITGTPSVTSLIYNEGTATMICTSSGGPATTVTWRRNGQELILTTNRTTYQQSQRVLDTSTATYENKLSGSAQNLVGSFTCEVSNAHGSANKSISTNGKHRSISHYS